MYRFSYAAVVAALAVSTGGVSEASVIARNSQSGPRMMVLPLFSETDAAAWAGVNGAQTASTATHGWNETESTISAFGMVLGVPGDSGWSLQDISPDVSIVPALASNDGSALITEASMVSFGASLTERLTDRGLLGAMSILR